MTKLEFSEDQQVFHYNSAGSRAIEGTNGFVTIGVYDSDREAAYFADFLQVQFIEKGKNLKAKEAKATLDNLCRFLSVYKDFLFAKHSVQE